MDSRAQEASASTFRGRLALIVGGSGGIGARVSAALAARGASVVVHGRSAAGVAAAVRGIRDAGGAAEGFQAPIESPQVFLGDLEKKFGARFAPGIVAVCFGPFERKPLAAHSPDDWSRLVLLNLALPGALASRFLPQMMESGYGRFLFFGGTRTDGIRDYKSNAPYAAAKTGLGVLAKSIAVEGSSRDVGAIVACPGLVDTEYLPEGDRESLRRIAPAGQLLDPDLIAQIALDLLDRSPCAASGGIISLDAGFSPNAQV